MLGVGVRDLTGGFKCFRREVLETIDLDSIQARGYAFQVEMTYRAIQRGFRVVEVPIVFHDRQVGSSKMSRRSSPRRSGGFLFYASTGRLPIGEGWPSESPRYTL